MYYTNEENLFSAFAIGDSVATGVSTNSVAGILASGDIATESPCFQLDNSSHLFLFSFIHNLITKT